ncbi:ATP-binding cassette domain-containing protein [Actinomadura sp. LD22]|uniref:ATP-binding cassette domain-containing protein n=1 Tax=Actinomadura physcomitrii TaxID=2650748 RepID=A0A6I4MY16_9ACTN|nr:metal ABC transporter ATP-binding protein [Actinomadura physcomitrii]MWA07286.1 ATP-binding cassette domain-containing protein [Actinomadura physcomitrii]
MTDGVRATDRDGAPPPFAMAGGVVRRDGREVLSGVDLRVEAGDVLAVLGPNGAGKSTLVKALLGLVPLAAGRTEIFGEPPARFRGWQRVGYVPQRLPMGGGVPSTVREVVASGRTARRSRWLPALVTDRAADRAAVDRALAAVGLAGRARDSAHLLSGGQQQRVLIARALAGEPDVFVMDEPTAGVDAASQAALAATLRGLADAGRTVVLVAHELGPLEPLITRTVELEHGRVARESAPSRTGSTTGSRTGSAA